MRWIRKHWRMVTVLFLLAVVGLAYTQSRWAMTEKNTSPPAVAAAEPTATPTPTAIPMAVVAPNVGSAFPTLFDAQSTGKGVGFAYDIGVNPSQHGLVFGYQAVWNGKSLGGPEQNGCALVILEPGFYPGLTIVDGRYEIRDLPGVNQDFWRRKLAVDRMLEQKEHYGCSDKKYEDIPVWKSSLQSPPATATTPAVTATTTPKTQTIAPTTTPVTPAPTATTAPAAERRPSGERQAIQFNTGESVYGWEIELADGRKCTGGECYLPSAPVAGKVTSGVVNPWDAEISAQAKANPWNP